MNPLDWVALSTRAGGDGDGSTYEASAAVIGHPVWPELVWLINAAAATAGCSAVGGTVATLLEYSQSVDLPEDDAVAGCTLFARVNPPLPSFDTTDTAAAAAAAAAVEGGGDRPIGVPEAAPATLKSQAEVRARSLVRFGCWLVAKVARCDNGVGLLHLLATKSSLGMQAFGGSARKAGGVVQFTLNAPARAAASHLQTPANYGGRGGSAAAAIGTPTTPTSLAQPAPLGLGRPLSRTSSGPQELPKSAENAFYLGTGGGLDTGFGSGGGGGTGGGAFGASSAFGGAFGGAFGADLGAYGSSVARAPGSAPTQAPAHVPTQARGTIPSAAIPPTSAAATALPSNGLPSFFSGGGASGGGGMFDVLEPLEPLGGTAVGVGGSGANFDPLEPMQADGTFKPLPPLQPFTGAPKLTSNSGSSSNSGGRRLPPGFTMSGDGNAAAAAAAASRTRSAASFTVDNPNNDGNGDDDDDVEDEQIMIQSATVMKPSAGSSTVAAANNGPSGAGSDAATSAAAALAALAALAPAPALAKSFGPGFLEGLGDIHLAGIPSPFQAGSTAGVDVGRWSPAAFGSGLSATRGGGGGGGAGANPASSFLPVPAAFMSATPPPVVAATALPSNMNTPQHTWPIGLNGAGSNTTALTDLVADATAAMQKVLKTAGDD